MPEAGHPDAGLIPEVPPVFQDGNRGMLPQNIPPLRNRAAVSAEGDNVRERLRVNMPYPTHQELRGMRIFRRNHQYHFIQLKIYVPIVVAEFIFKRVHVNIIFL